MAFTPGASVCKIGHLQQESFRRIVDAVGVVGHQRWLGQEWWRQEQKPLPLTDQQEQDLEGVLKDARDYYRKKGLISEQEWSEYMEVVHLEG